MKLGVHVRMDLLHYLESPRSKQTEHLSNGSSAGLVGDLFLPWVHALRLPPLTLGIHEMLHFFCLGSSPRVSSGFHQCCWGRNACVIEHCT
jgi:hypothetical protein